MDTLNLLGSVMGLGFLAGIRLYATVLALGLAIRFNLFHLTGTLGHLTILSDWRILTAAGAACLLEFVADKVPWVDSFWDSAHTFIRPIGAAVLGATALGDLDPALRVVLALLCGGVALSSHSAKASARIMVNHSPEPFSNIATSLFEDFLVPAGIWLVISHPLFTFCLVMGFIGLFIWIAPKIYRAIRTKLETVKDRFRRLGVRSVA